MEEADFDLESMPDDEIMSIFRGDNDEADSDQELSTVDAKAADHILDELINEANKEDTNVSAATTNDVSSASVPKSASTSSPADIQTLIAKAVWKKNIPRVKIPNIQTLGAIRRYKEIQITKASGLDPLGHLLRRLDFLAIKVHNVAQNLLTHLIKKFDSATNTIPRIDEMLAVLQEYVLKPMNREFKALNKLESQSDINRLLRQCVKHQMQLIKYIEQIIHSSIKVPRDILVVNAKHLQTKVDKTFVDLHELVDLVSQLMKIISMVPFTKATVEGEKESQEQPKFTTTDDSQSTKVHAPA
ncbi:hypothetical protein Tco_0756609 [Tanacetum coccineum]